MSDSGSEAEIVGTIHTSDAPWFNVDEHYVVRETAMEEALDEFKEACDLDALLKFRRFMTKAVPGETSLVFGRSRETRVSPWQRARYCQASRLLQVGPGCGFPCQAPPPPRLKALGFPGVLVNKQYTLSTANGDKSGLSSNSALSNVCLS
jgi:hypothetical protein